MKRFFIISAFFILILGFSPKVFASDLFSGNPSTSVQTSTNPAEDYPGFVQNFTATSSGVIADVNFSFSSDTSNVIWSIQAYGDTATSNPLYIGSTCGDNTMLGSFDTMHEVHTTNFSVYHGTDSMVAGGTYFFTLAGTNESCSFYTTAGSNHLSTLGNGDGDYDFSISDTPFVSAPFSYLDFPVNGSTIPDFENWSVEYGAMTGDFRIGVNYSDDLTTLNNCLDFPTMLGSYSNCINGNPHINVDYSPTFSLGVAGMSDIPKSINLVAGKTYYAQAVAQDADGNNIANSDVVSFTIGTPPAGLSSCDAIVCDSLDIGCYITKALTCVFVPTQASLSQFNGLYGDVVNKPPFGYVSAVYSSLQSINDTNASQFTLTTLPILNTYIFTPIRTGLIFVLWVGFLFILFHRFKNIDL